MKLAIRVACLSSAFLGASIPPLHAQEESSSVMDVTTFSDDYGLAIGIPSKIDFGPSGIRDFSEILSNLKGASPSKVPTDLSWIFVPDAGYLPESERQQLDEYLASGLCTSCYGTGVVNIPIVTSIPGVYTGSQLAAVVNPGTSWSNEIEEVFAAISRLILHEAERIGGVCTMPFLGNTAGGVLSPWGNSIEVDIIAPSEVFSRDRPGLWYLFTVSVQESSSEVSWAGGLAKQRRFIIDSLRYSGRGVCSEMFPSLARTPLPSEVNEVFDGANQQIVELEVASFLTKRLGTFSTDWNELFESEK